MDVRQILAAVWRRLRQRPWRSLAFAGLALGLALIAMAAGFLMPRTVQFSYAGDNCFSNPALLPRLISPATSRSFKARPVTALSLAGYPLYSQRSCLELTAPTDAAETETISMHASGLPFAHKNVYVKPGVPPAASRQAANANSIATSGAVMFALSGSDRVFSYRLHAGKAVTTCSKIGRQISCNADRLQLAHATGYVFRLERLFGEQPAGTAFAQKLTTVQTVEISDSTIKTGQLLFERPGELSLTLSRAASRADNIRLLDKTGDKPQQLPVRFELKDKSLIVTFDQPLPRSANLTLEVNSLRAADGGYMVAPYALSFRTSGGPKVLGVNIGSYNVAAGSLANLNLRLDSATMAGQNLSEAVRVESGGKVLAAAISGNGSNIAIRLNQGLPACSSFTIRVLDNLQNSFGVAGGSAWSFNSRTTCQTVFSIGSSVQGRAISAYRFGSGSSNMVFVGATHGDERSSATILQRWIDYLEANPSAIPGQRSVTIIPVLNPDGYAADKRTNANNVDLNRNFPANNWKQSVTMPDKSTNANGGGSSPLSEPESKALAGFVQAQKPRLVLTYHATGNVVSPNSTDDSDTLARRYAGNSSVYYLSPSSTASFFEYDTTGAFEDWLHDKAGIPALLVELDSFGGNEFNGHLPALKIMAGL